MQQPRASLDIPVTYSKDQSAPEDVSERVLKQRKRMRKPGAVPYPLQSNVDIIPLLNWNHMFLRNLCRNLTAHHFESPPTMILELGCGSGFWAIEAARKWPMCRVIGFDILKCQPDLSRVGMNDIADRVKWVHGNFLEPLPYPEAFFDYVRMCDLGYAVPEDEWQDLLEEVARVMTPGAVIEVIDEDLIFPCADAPMRKNESSTPHQSIEIPALTSPNTDTTIPDPSTKSIYSNGISNFSKASYSSTVSSSPPNPPSLTSQQPFPIIVSENEEIGDASLQIFPQPDYAKILDPQDHSRLKLAWQKMLNTRFLAIGLTQVLPFYLSSEFSDIMSHPTMHILLPPNSDVVDRWRRNSVDSGDDQAHFEELQAFTVRTSWDSSRAERASRRSATVPSLDPVEAFAHMHLAKTMATIVACKESIWEEYRGSDGSEYLPESEGASREEFEAAWANWENDMKDRMGMRNTLSRSVSWEPPKEDELSRPGWRSWRRRIGIMEDTEPSFGDDAVICRSIKGFVGIKTTSPQSNSHGPR